MLTWFNARETLILTAFGAAFCLVGSSFPAAAPPAQPNASTSLSPTGFIVLTEPVRLKIAYGETTLPAGMRLPVVSSDATSVRINYMGEVQTISVGVARFETASDERQDSAAPTTAPIPSAQPPAAVAATAQVQVSLQPGYDTRMQGGDVSMRELQMLLSSHCTQGIDLSGAGTKIYRGVTYLMDSEQAVPALGLGHVVPSRVPVATAGFPRNSLYYIGYDGAFEGHFNRLYLVTDTANKVVAVQLLDEHPKSRWKSASSLASANWNTYNFINARMRASDITRVNAVAKREGGVIAIDTHLYQFVRKKLGRTNVDRYEEQENAKLFIPMPFARIILHCAQIGLSKT